VSGKMCEMYHLYVNELSKLLRLLLMLASRLARADNALISTKHDSSNHKVIVLASLQFFSNVSCNMPDPSAPRWMAGLLNVMTNMERRPEKIICE